MRVTTSMIYDSVIRYTSDALANYYDLTEQNSSMKKVNSASDDPSGYSTILSLRNHLSSIDQYQENVSTASGWLSSADDALNEASSLITSIIELAEQGATGTMTDDDREAIAEEVREYLASIISLANTEYGGSSIFAGQDTDGSAYELGLYADVTDSTLDQDFVLEVTGDADTSIKVQFLTSGTVGTDELEYQYSTDGGDTWTSATLAAGDTELDLGTCRVSLASGSAVTAETGDGDGTSLVVRPTAVYVGDADDGAIVVSYADSVCTATASGLFDDSVVVRIDSDGSVASGAGVVSYSYSTDGGNTWIEGLTSEDGIFQVDGGFLYLASNAGADVYAGDQYVVASDDADIDLAISENSSVSITTVGLDAFGGIYQAYGDDYASAVSNGGNLFETIGKLIGALETNDIDTVGECVDLLSDAQSTLLTVASDVGARENKVTAMESLLELRESADEETLSNVEDADVTELMVELESAATIYQSVVETSTTIMSLSMVNYM